MKILAEKSKYHRFAVQYDYAPDRVEFCRTLKDSFGWERFSYDSTGSKRWVFSEPIFVRLFQEQYPTVQIEPEVLKTIQHEDALARKEYDRGTKIDVIRDKKDTDFNVKGLRGELYPYQKVGVEFLNASGGRAIIADEMGLGKTVQALAYVKHMKFERTLVVSPASVKFVWEGEVKKWTNLSCVIIDSKTKLHEIDVDVKIWVLNYDILRKHLPELLKIRFDCVIADECHLVKSPAAIRTKAFRQLANHADSVIMLTGTPLLSRPVEMFTLLNVIDKKTWSNYYEYTRKFCAGHQTRWGYDVSGASHIDELHEKIRRYFLRRRKEEVLTDLPEKNRIQVPVELSKDAAKQYNEAERDLGEYLKKYEGKQPAAIAKTLQAEKLARLNVLRQLCAQGKIPAACEIIDSILDSGEKVLVFSSFVGPLEQLLERYTDSAVILTGQTPINERGYIVERFQKDPRIRIFLGGIKSAGVGITLTAASNVIALDYSWNPADHAQSEGRAHRIGQKNAVSVYQLTAKGTIDEKMAEMLEYKQNIFDRLIDGQVTDNKDEDTIDAVIRSVANKK
jgi:SWI/SNF-related matrix-associated actin-dependent regulator 1 of chromatin subfamily A